jgi:diacylglycerol kinase (ATP)
VLNRFDGPTITLVVNPKAGRGRAGRVLPKVCASLLAALPDVHLRVHRATSYDDARLRTIQAVQVARPGVDGGPSLDTLAVMGGDGMAHLGINACATSDVPLAVIPAGTGNDFCRSAGLPVTLRGAVQTLVSRNVVSVDLNEVTGDLVDGAERRWVGCSVCTGYEAVVSQGASRSPVQLGGLTYGITALRELARFSPVRYELEIDGETRRLDAMFATVCNGAYFGGGMKVAPRADLTDGELDVTIVHPVPRSLLLRLLPRMYDGSFIKHPAVELLRAKQVRVRTHPSTIVDGDGELLGRTPVDVRAVGGALRLVVPATRTSAREVTP